MNTQGADSFIYDAKQVSDDLPLLHQKVLKNIRQKIQEIQENDRNKKNQNHCKLFVLNMPRLYLL